MKLSEYISHIRDFHSHHPFFSIKCGLHGCPKVFQKFPSFRNHVYDRHGSDPSVTNQPEVVELNPPMPCVLNPPMPCDVDISDPNSADVQDEAMVPSDEGMHTRSIPFAYL